MPYHRQLTQFRANMHLNRKNDHSSQVIKNAIILK